MTLYRTKRLFSSTLFALLTFMVVAANAELDPRSRVRAQAACSWSLEHLFVVNGKATDEQEKLIDKLLNALQNAIGGAIPEVAAVKTAIDKVSIGGDTVTVQVIYSCTDKAGKITRRRDTLDNTENDLWAAKWNLVKGGEKAELDRKRQIAIIRHRPTISCCPPKPAPGQQPGPNQVGPQPPVTPAAADPCTVPPPCDACKPIYGQIAAKCARMGKIPEELRDLAGDRAANANRQDYARKEIAKAEEQGAAAKVAQAKAELKKEETEATAIEADDKKLRAEQAKLPAEIKDLANQLKTCEKDRCGKTATGNPGGIDRCLIGKWRSQSTISGPFMRTWGGGVLLDIKTSGAILVNYDGMEPKVNVDALGNISLSQTWRGKASGTIGTTAGNVDVKTVESSALTYEATQYGKTSTNAISGLGIVFITPIKKVKYTCGETTLTLQPMLVEGFGPETYFFSKLN